MSAAPRPYRRPSRCVGTKGSLVHRSSGPVGTTSVWPAKTSVGPGRPPSCMAHRLVTRASVGPGRRSSRRRSRAAARRCGEQGLAAAVVGRDRTAGDQRLGQAQRLASPWRPAARVLIDQGDSSPTRGFLRAHVERDLGEDGRVGLFLLRRDARGRASDRSAAATAGWSASRRSARPSSRVIMPSLIRRAMSCSKVCEPSASDFSIASLTPPKSPFSISSAISLVLSSTSTAGMRPPALARSRRCETIARRPEARSRQQRRPRLGRVERQDAAQRVVAVVGVQGGQHEVARQRVRDRRGHGLAVADLADQDAVGRLAQRVLQRRSAGSACRARPRAG